MFHEEVITTENKTVAQILGQLLHERELTISCAESCTGGNIAHRIVQVPGSSSYFQGSVVSYSNDVKVNVLGVKRTDLEKNGAVSRQVVQQMVEGVCRIMRTDCGIATSGISGPDGGSLFKPVGTVWLAVKCLDKVVTECVHFNGNRDEVIESATNHGMIMLINMLRNSYMIQEDFNDE
jgi:nicotinamide-nucleotide amidase